MIDDLSPEQVEEYIDLQNKRTDFPQEMSDGDWERLNQLQETRFQGE